MFGAIAGGIASALAGGAMSKLFGGGQKAASGGIQGDVLATDNNTRSEERRVGKECRCRGARHRKKKNLSHNLGDNALALLDERQQKMLRQEFEMSFVICTLLSREDF